MKFSLSHILSLRLSKTIYVGGLASLIDMAALLLLTEVFGVSPQIANIPSLVVGSAVQFLGNRRVVFKARDGLLGQQLIGFASAEIGAFTINAVGFHLLVTYTQMSFVLARPLVCALVFFGFSYPLWTSIFKVRGSQNSG